MADQTAALRNLQRIKHVKGYAMTTTSFEGVNNTKIMHKTNTAPKIKQITVGSMVEGTTPKNILLATTEHQSTSDSHWNVKEPKYLEINKSILAKKHR